MKNRSASRLIYKNATLYNNTEMQSGRDEINSGGIETNEVTVQ